MKDILGNALLDYQHGRYTEDLMTETSISEADEMPLPYLFRSFDEMPLLEKEALGLARGSVLDVGCGAGSHALYLQQQGLKVTAIDSSPGAVEVCKLRGVEEALELDFKKMTGDKFDTILMLMNGSGIFENLEKLPSHLHHIKSILHKNGQLLVDSSDLIYMYDTSEEGGVWVPGDKYYGEITYTLSYKGEATKPFEWLYIDADLFRTIAVKSGFNFEVIARGEHYDYLARLTY